MAEIPAAQVKKLRDATGAGMMAAKRALEEAGGDQDQAAELLRIKGETKVKERGAERVVGIDSDERYLAQARFAAGVLGAEIEFRQMTVYDVARLEERFDLGAGCWVVSPEGIVSL